jgi:uncharacterized protein (TIGR02466 family)
MKEGQTYCLFPTPIHHNNIGHNFKVEVNDLTTCYDSTIGPDSFDKPNGLITKDQNYLLNEENKLLRQKLEEVIDIYLRQHLRINKKVGIKHQCSWGLLHKKGHSSPRHYHRNSWLSGIYYFQVNEKSGDFEVTDTPPYGWTCSSMAPFEAIDEYNAITNRSVTFSPKRGDVFLFPSHLEHHSYINNSEQDRIAVGFNYTLTGSWGSMAERIHLA